MRQPLAFLRCRRGTSSIEFAIIGPILLLFVFGTFEFGRLLWTHEALQEAAESGARCMGVLQSSCASSGAYSSAKTLSRVENLAAGWSVALPAADITLNQSATCGGVTGFSQVSISYAFQSVVPGLIKALAGTITLSTSACFPNRV